MATENGPYTPNQLVAFNLRRARRLREWSQEQAAAAAEPHLGRRWSKATWSAAERSIEGTRIREFTADDLVAFARTFDLPVAWFLMPPPQIKDDPGHGLVRAHTDGPAFTAAELVDKLLVLGALREPLETFFGTSWHDGVVAGTMTPTQRQVVESQQLLDAALVRRASGELMQQVNALRDLADVMEANCKPTDPEGDR